MGRNVSGRSCPIQASTAAAGSVGCVSAPRPLHSVSSRRGRQGIEAELREMAAQSSPVQASRSDDGCDAAGLDGLLGMITTATWVRGTLARGRHGVGQSTPQERGFSQSAIALGAILGAARVASPLQLGHIGGGVVALGLSTGPPRGRIAASNRPMRDSSTGQDIEDLSRSAAR